MDSNSLSQFGYARVFSINPIHFSGGESIHLLRRDLPCSKVWSRYSWQQPDQASHQDLWNAISEAEEAILDYIGYPVAPTWLTNIQMQHPKRYGTHLYAPLRDTTGRRPALFAGYGRVIAPGVRATSLVLADADVIYTDDDVDNFDENATVLVVIDPLIDHNEIRIFQPGSGADPDYELREFHFAGEDGLGNWKFQCKRWHLVNESAYERIPGREESDFVIDLDVIGNVWSTVDVYRVYNDETAPSVEYYWEEGVDGYPVTQSGFFTIRDADAGLVVPTPGHYDTDLGKWIIDNLTVGRSPDRVTFNYLAGNRSKRNLSNPANDPMETYIARAIAELATARLTRDVCECPDDQMRTRGINDLREEMAFSSEQGNFLAIAEQVQVAPFGSRKGEWQAYMKLKRMPKVVKVGVI